MKSSFCRIGKRAGRALSAETGQSLVLALIVVLALTVSVAGLITYVTSNETSFNRDRDATRALAIAEAGIQNASSVISQYDDATDVCVYAGGSCAAGRVPPSGATSYNTDGGSGSWYAEKTQASGTNVKAVWAITATAKSPDGRVTRTVTANIGALPPQTVTLPIFGYALYVGGSGSPPTGTVCGNNDSVNNTYVGGSFTATGNFWVGNNLCLSGGSKISLNSDNNYTLYTGGGVKVTGSSAVADSVKRLKSATVVGGCYDNTGPVTCSNTSRSNVFAMPPPAGYNVGSTFQQASQKPPIDWTVYTAANWQSWASPGTCSGTPPHFEETTDNYSSPVPSNTIKLDQNDYNCTFVDSATNFVGSLAYSSSTNQLTISGKLFINGNLDMTSTPGFKYIGNGTIYVNGVVTNKNDVCGYPTTPTSTNCDASAGTWNQSQANIEIVAMNAGNCPQTQTTPCTATGWNVNGSGEYDGIAFVRGAITGTGNGSTTNFKGPVITDFVNQINGGGGLYYPSDPPAGSEGVTQIPQPWALIPGSWIQQTN